MISRTGCEQPKKVTTVRVLHSISRIANARTKSLPSVGKKQNQPIPLNVTRNQEEKGWLTSKRMSLDSRKMLISVSDALEICNRATCLSQQQTFES